MARDFPRTTPSGHLGSCSPGKLRLTSGRLNSCGPPDRRRLSLGCDGGGSLLILKRKLQNCKKSLAISTFQNFHYSFFIQKIG